MKRSEMLCAIDKRFPTLHMECNLEELLAFLEEQGMQPPNITLEEMIPGTLRHEETFYYSCWEPEITQQTVNESLEHIGKKGLIGKMEITE